MRPNGSVLVTVGISRDVLFISTLVSRCPRGSIAVECNHYMIGVQATKELSPCLADDFLAFFADSCSSSPAGRGCFLGLPGPLAGICGSGSSRIYCNFD